MMSCSLLFLNNDEVCHTTSQGKQSNEKQLSLKGPFGNNMNFNENILVVLNYVTLNCL